MATADLTEEWRPVVGYEGIYEISSLGRVRNLATRQGTTAGLILRQSPNGIGYASLSLTRDGISITYRVHALVLAAFVGIPPEGCEANHRDRNKMNARLDNLEYVSHLENVHHAMHTGLRRKTQKGTQNPAAKLSEMQIGEIRDSASAGLSYRDLSIRYGVAKSQIARIVRRHSWGHL